MTSLDELQEIFGRVQRFIDWAVLAGVNAPTHDAVQAPWTAEQVYRLNRRQEDDRVESYRCPADGADLFATRSGWLCPRPVHRCGFRQTWALARHIDHPFIPPHRRSS